MNISCSLFLLGMGEMSGGPAPIDKIPVPEKNYSAGVLDRQGVQTNLQSFSFEGKGYLAAKHGNASVAIPFEKINEIQFQGPEGDQIGAKVILRDQKTIWIKIERRAKFYGKTDFGTYQIEAQHLKLIRF